MRILMSPNNAEVCVGLPLYRRSVSTAVQTYYTVSLVVEDDEPLAYVIDAGEFMPPQVVSAEWVHKYMIDLGEL